MFGRNKTTRTEKKLKPKTNVEAIAENDFSINMDGNPISMSKLITRINKRFDNNSADEIRFNFSGDNYLDLKKQIENYPSDAGTEFIVLNIVIENNQSGILSESYTVIIRKRYD